MQVFTSIVQSIASQNIIGWLVILIITILLLVGLILNIKVKIYYKNLFNDLKENSSKNSFNIIELNKILDRFKKSATKGTENINTEVLIEKNLKIKIIKSEKWINILPAIFIACGLLGTFLGLTLAIFETKTALNSIENINNFTVSLQAPISSMSSAFWTSIFGVTSSVVLNAFNVLVRNEREKFYNYLEDYLDNEVFANHANTFNVIFQEFNRTVKLTMLTLTEEMKQLFQNGVEELVNKINSNSIDLTKSAEALQNYTNEFEKLVKSLDNTVLNFEKPVDKFKNSIENFVVISNDLNERFTESFDALINKVDHLDSNFKILSNSIYDNKEALSEMGRVISDEAESLRECYKAFEDGLQEVRWLNEIQNKEFLSQIDNVNKGYESFSEGFVEFKKSLENLEISLARGFAGVVQGELNSLSKDFIKELHGPLMGIKESTEELAGSINIVGQLIKATNEWVAVSTFDSNEVESVIKYEG